VRIFNDGFCLWQPRYELSVTQCDVDDTWFPFDKQTCQLIFLSWLVYHEQLKLIPILHLINYQAEYIESNEWEIVGKCLSDFVNISFVYY